MGRHSCGNPCERPNPYPRLPKPLALLGHRGDISLGGDVPHASAAPFMDLAMFGLHERVPDPKAKLVEVVGVPPTRPTPPQISHCTSWCADGGE